MKFFFYTLLAALGLFALTFSIAHLRFQYNVDGLADKLLENSQANASSQIVTSDRLEGLPEPVQRYLNVSGVVGQPFQNNLRLLQEGRFRQSATKPWMNVSAKQYFSTMPVGFVWDATFSLYGIPAARAYDSHLNQRGHMFGRMFGLFPLMDAEGSELSQGTLMRYLAELIWMPSAYLGENITWKERDNQSAIVTLQDGEQIVSMTMFFDESGDLVNMEGQRYGDFDGIYTIQTWTVPITAYAEFEGIRVPSEGKVIWKLLEGDLVYFDWKITDIQYNVSLP